MIRAYIALAAVAAALAGLAWGGRALHQAGAAGVRAEWAATDARQAEEARLLARERATNIERIDRESIPIAARRAAADRDAAVAGDGLRIKSTEVIAAATAASPAGQCEAALAAAGVHADVLGRMEAAGRRMAAVATERGDAGQACVTAFDAVRGAPAEE